MSATETQTQPSSIKVSAQSILSGPVQAKLNFYDPPADGAKPYNYVEEPPAGEPRTNFGPIEHTVTIDDIRGRESEFSLAKHAFLPVLPSATNPPSKADFNSEESIKNVYYPEVEQLLLKNLPGSPNRVLIFDHTIRRPNSNRTPVNRTHIDQTAASAEQRVHHHLPAEAETLLKGRYRIVNVWRPLNGPVETSPLAVADSSTLSDENLIGVEHRYPDRTGETAAIKFQEETKWWYWSGMTDDERLFLQCYDNQDGSRVPHSAFEDERNPNGKPRESIEARALVFG